MATNWPTSRDTFTNPTSGDTLDSPSHAAQHANVNDAVEAMQAHAGLVLVKPTGATNGTVGANGAVTIGSAVSSVTVTGAFSSSFSDYLVTLTGTTPSAGAYFTFSFSSGHSAGYYGRYKTENYLGTVDNQNRNDAANLYVGYANPAAGSSSAFVNVCSPNLAQRKSIFGNAGSGPGFAIYGGEYGVTTTHTDFYMTVTSGTLTGGTIRVYGYNNG